MGYLSGADAYPVAELDEIGLDADRVADLVARARREIDAGALPSCQLALARKGRLGLFVTLGEADPSSRYIVFSSTKAVTAAVIWLLMTEAGIAPEQPVTDFVPEFGTNGKDTVTVANLLTHTGGFPYAPLGPPAWLTREGRLRRFGEWRLNWEPDSRYEYHPTSAHWVLAEIAERVSGKDLRDLVRTRISEPLGLRLSLGAPVGRQDDVKRIVPFGEPPTPDQLAELGIPGWDPGEVVNENLTMMNTPENMALGVPGGGGVASAADMVLFYQALLHNPGEMWERGTLAKGTAEILCTMKDPITRVASNRSLGLCIAGDDGDSALRGFGYTVSGQAFGHDGAGGQIAWADPASGLSFSYLTNGMDAFVPNQWRRVAGLSSRAAVCAS